MINIEKRLKTRYPNYSEIIDRMILVAEEIVCSKDYAESISTIVPTLDAMDAYVLGMISGEMIKDGVIHVGELGIDLAYIESIKR